MHFELTLRSLPRERDWIALSELGLAFGRGTLGTRWEAIVNRSSERHIAQRPCCGTVCQGLTLCRFDYEAKRFFFEPPVEVHHATA
jgi:hypothetical protein